MHTYDSYALAKEFKSVHDVIQPFDLPQVQDAMADAYRSGTMPTDVRHIYFGKLVVLNYLSNY